MMPAGPASTDRSTLVSTDRSTLAPDLDEARRFLAVLDTDATSFVFQTFDDGPQKRREIARTRGGSLDLLADSLANLQAQGAGVYVTVNQTVGNRRRIEDVDLVRALFVDLDGAPLDPVLASPLDPHMIVESSPNKYHAYWIVDGLPLDLFKPWQKRLAAIFGGDKRVNDLPRVMRIPGFWHRKGSPFQTRIVQTVERWPYDLEDFIEAFGELPMAGAHANGHDAGEAADPAEHVDEAELVRMIMASESYHDPLRNLAYRHLVDGMQPKAVKKLLHGIMASVPGPRDDRWQARDADVDRAVDTASAKLKANDPTDLTEDQIAREISAKLETDARHTGEWDRWHVWGGDYWHHDASKKWALNQVRDHLTTLSKSIAEKYPRKRAAAMELRDARKIFAVERLVKTSATLAAVAGQWDRDQMLLGSPSGTIDLRTGEDVPPRQLDYITKSIAVAPAPPGTPTPLWDGFLRLVTGGDDAYRAYLQRVAGYWLTGDVSEHVFFFVYGGGGNGKSTFVETIMKILQDYAVTIPSELLMVSTFERHPTDQAQLRGMRLGVASEVEEGRAWAESKIKSLTGGDRITARYMRCDPFQFTPTFKLVVYGNHKPKLMNVDEAIRRRMHLLPFTVAIDKVVERDKEFPAKLQAEWRGILRWAMDGCRQWQEIGLRPPEIVTAATVEYLAAEDSLALWLAEKTVAEAQGRLPCSVAYDSWRQWAQNNGEVIGSQNTFSKRMSTRFVKLKSSGMHYQGLKLKPVPGATKNG